jgi:hypothetical protein
MNPNFTSILSRKVEAQFKRITSQATQKLRNNIFFYDNDHCTKPEV